MAINQAVYDLAEELVNNFEAMPLWSQEIIVAWAERILAGQEPPPEFLFQFRNIDKGHHGTRTTKETDTLNHLRSRYESALGKNFTVPKKG